MSAQLYGGANNIDGYIYGNYIMLRINEENPPSGGGFLEHKIKKSINEIKRNRKNEHE